MGKEVREGPRTCCGIKPTQTRAAREGGRALRVVSEPITLIFLADPAKMLAVSTILLWLG